ncbi:MAG: hypothetical protein ISR58_11555 [Anaerolineales bacterium]|nr:hypothetical protein [Chloroflexota bacterium]MBL6981811.1 hypothetical protein [Anaerolineales bacterium]
MKQSIVIAFIMLFAISCSMPSILGQENSASGIQPSTAASEKRCGDNVCDGPENADNCPGDCTQPALGENSQEIQPADSGGETEAGYRYVSFSGTINTALNSELIGDFAGTAFEYSGDYGIELWFPIEGGQAVQQRNSIVLTEFKDLYFGDIPCSPCDWKLDENAYEPVQFELNASLNLTAIEENNQPADELVYQLIDIPRAAITGIVECPCENSAPDDFSDPAAFTQMLGWFMGKLVNPIHLSVIETNSVENYAVSPMGYLNIPKETLSYVIVPDLETP